MQTIQIEDNLNSILEIEHINPKTALKEYLMMEMLSKKEKYLLEIKRFEKKYNSSFSKFEKEIHSKNKENFDIEDDLMDWEFAVESLKTLENNLLKLRIKNDF